MSLISDDVKAKWWTRLKIATVAGYKTAVIVFSKKYPVETAAAQIFVDELGEVIKCRKDSNKPIEFKVNGLKGDIEEEGG